MDEERKGTSKYDQLEMARIIGQPVDPRKPYPLLVSNVCTVDSADPDEYVYYFDVLQDTDRVYTTVANGVTQVAVTPDTPTAFTFEDLASPEYYIKITDLADAKERVLARKKRTIDRALNAWENYKILTVTDAAVQAGNIHDLKSGTNHFNYENLVDMIDGIIDYSDDYILVAGTQIDKDIKLWDWTDNKYTSLAAAFKDLDVEVMRIHQTITLDGGSTNVLDSSVAYLYGRNTEDGKPCLFVRKRLDSIKLLGGVVADDGEMPERLIFTSPNPITVTGSAIYLAIAVTGYENVICAVTNPYAIAKFNRN